ncbi:MAG: DNA cytosine methyltransferase [Oscillospiraceae bacterium]|nr:DNA cytosine methyltransferase [Oscillospiraceae bacterium]
MGKTIPEKSLVLDYLWQHSRFCSNRLYECEELYRQGRGHAAIFMLFSCFESICKSVANDYDSSSYSIYKKLYEQKLLTDSEYAFISTDEFSLRKIRNLFAHANIGAINLIVNECEKEILWPLGEDDTAILLYEKISDIVFALVLKLISATFIEEVKKAFVINLDNEIDSCQLQFRTLTAKEMLLLKGFPDDYISEDLDIPEDAKIRLIDNAPDVNVYKYIFENITKLTKDKLV